MSLRKQQKLLAGLYTDPKLREEYFKEKKDQSYDQNEVSIFAEGLVLKRWNVVKSWLPLSFAYKGKVLYQLFLIYANTNPMNGMHLKHHKDVLSFYDFVKDQKDVEAYLLEILSYEVFYVKSYLPEYSFLFGSWNFKFYNATPQNIQSKDSLYGKSFRILWRMSSTKKWKQVI